MSNLNINPLDYIPNHKYIRQFSSEEDFQTADENREFFECACIINNNTNTTEEQEYQPSIRETNGDNLVRFHYLNNDNIKYWAGLKIIWGYFGWEEHDFELNGETLKGGNFYKVKPMTILKIVPDLYQYQHLNNFLKNVNSVEVYEEQDFSTIKSASYLVNHNNVTIPRCYTELDSLTNIFDNLYIGEYLRFETDVININNISNINKFIISQDYIRKLLNTPKISIDKLENFNDDCLYYEAKYVTNKINNSSDSDVIINSFEAYINYNKLLNFNYYYHVYQNYKITDLTKNTIYNINSLHNGIGTINVKNNFIACDVSINTIININIKNKVNLTTSNSYNKNSIMIVNHYSINNTSLTINIDKLNIDFNIDEQENFLFLTKRNTIKNITINVNNLIITTKNGYWLNIANTSNNSSIITEGIKVYFKYLKVNADKFKFDTTYLSKVNDEINNIYVIFTSSSSNVAKTLNLIIDDDWKFNNDEFSFYHNYINNYTLELRTDKINTWNYTYINDVDNIQDRYNFNFDYYGNSLSEFTLNITNLLYDLILNIRNIDNLILNNNEDIIIANRININTSDVNRNVPNNNFIITYSLNISNYLYINLDCYTTNAKIYIDANNSKKLLYIKLNNPNDDYATFKLNNKNTDLSEIAIRIENPGSLRRINELDFSEFKLSRHNGYICANFSLQYDCYNLKLNKGYYNVDLYDRVEDIDFNIYHDTLLINYNSNFYNNSKQYNVLTIHRNFYNKFTDEEKEQLIASWKTINIRENVTE